MVFDQIKILMDRKGLSSKDIAGIAGVVPSAITKWKNGSTIRTDALQRLSDYFGVSISWLVTGREVVFEKKLAYQTNRDGVVPGSLSLHDNSEEYMALPDGPCKNCALLQAELDAVKEQLARQNSVIDKLLQK